MKDSKGGRRFIHYLPVFGSISTGLIYGAIGVIAILSLLQIKEGGADESSLFAYLNDFLIGKIFIWILLLGTFSYVCWRIYEAFKDPYNYGSHWMGIGRRTGIGLSSIADILIAYSAVMILLGKSNSREDGVPEEEREMVGNMLGEGWGDWFVVSIGIIIFATACVQFYYGISRGYKERLEIGDFSKGIKKSIHYLAWIGYLARGIIIGIIGFFFVKAGLTDNAQYIVNTDKAFNFIGENLGAAPFVLVAAGTIAYSIFMFFLGITYDIDNKKSREKKSLQK